MAVPSPPEIAATTRVFRDKPMRVDNASDRSQISRTHDPSTSTTKGTAMLTLPYRTMIHQKRWATNGLNAVIADTMERLPLDERVLVVRLLDHIQVVDEIFRHNLEARPHGYQAPRSAELPSFDAVAHQARATADWYADYADALKPEKLDEAIAFSFSNGEPARMTRGEILLHVATHAAGHRGQVALLLQKNGIQPFPDRITDFLKAEDTHPQRQAPLRSRHDEATLVGAFPTSSRSRRQGRTAARIHRHGLVRSLCRTQRR